MPPGVTVGRAGGRGFPELWAEGLQAPCSAAPTRLYWCPRGHPLGAAVLGGSLPGPLPSKGWASFLTRTGPLGRAFQGLLRANLGTWTFTPAAFQQSDVFWETPQLQGAGGRPEPLTAGHRGPRKQHQEHPAGTERVHVTGVCSD